MQYWWGKGPLQRSFLYEAIHTSTTKQRWFFHQLVFYTSPLLVDALGITLTGTVLSNKQGLPVEIKTKQEIPKGTTESYTCGNMMALAWQDKRKILMLSTKYTNKMIEIQPR